MTTNTLQKWFMVSIKDMLSNIDSALCEVGMWLGPLGLRLILAWEFWESGIEKLHGENWFEAVVDNFPWPFNVIPVDISWQMATWGEIIGAVALLVGLGTRFFSLSLFVVTIVAIAAVHWPTEWHTFAELAQGYVLTAVDEEAGTGNYKLPLIFLVMLWPLMFGGAGKLSLDSLISWMFRRNCCAKSDAA